LELVEPSRFLLPLVTTPLLVLAVPMANGDCLQHPEKGYDQIFYFSERM
jgi:hypothetical protein